MTVFRYQIVGSGCKSTIDELVVIGISCDDPHAKVGINELHVLLVEDEQYDVLSNGGRYLLGENFLILFQYFIRHT